MTTPNTIDSLISTGTSQPGLRGTIIQAIFNSVRFEANELNDRYDLYFAQCYEDHCKRCLRQIPIKTHGELLEIVQRLKISAASRSTFDIGHEMIQEGVSYAERLREVEATIVLAARILCMLSIGTIDNCLPPGRIVPWERGTLLDAITAEFPVSTAKEIDKLPKIFKAVNLEKIAGIRVTWTSNLADHLSMGVNEVRLFHHVSFLTLHKHLEDVFPEGFVVETLRTIALLIPSNDPETAKWIKKQKEIDTHVAKCGHLKVADRHTGKFEYWKDRLIILQEAFDESEPDSVKQWWYDDRKKVQRWTFWIAALVLVLTIVFGLIQSITGGISAWAAIQALHQS